MSYSSRRGQQDRRAMEQREMAALKRAAGINRTAAKSADAERQWRAQIEVMPADTRDFTARFFGDPIQNDPRRQSA